MVTIDGRPFERPDSWKMSDAERKVEVAAQLRDKAGAELAVKRAHYYDLLRAEQAALRELERRAEQTAALEKLAAAEAEKTKSFADDVLKFFGIKV
jgi:hypothetical protein